MVARIFILLTVLGWLMPPATGFGAVPFFGMTVKSGQVEFGKPVYIDLHTRYLQPYLSTLDLSPLDRDFVVETPDNVEHDTDGSQQSWRIRLYPRRPGELLIPPLLFHGYRTEPYRVIVTPSVDHKNNAPLLVSNEVGGTSVWINQAVQVTMQVESDSRYAWLDTETAHQDGIEIVALPETHHTWVQNGVRRTQLRIGWVLYPQTTGTITLQLPPVKYQRDGVITHRFYPPKIQLHVRALPAFVPPTMPVGRMQLEVSMPDKLFLVKRKLVFLSLRIRSEGPPGQYPSEVLRQLKSNQTVTFYPPREMTDENDLQMDNGKEGRYQVPFAPKIMGLISMPSVRLQFFDPSTGKIETQNYSLGKFVAVGQWVVYTGVTILLLGVMVLARFLYRRLKRQLQVYQCYRTALRKLQQARTPGELKSALMDIAGAESWPTNLTLDVWLNYWITYYPRLSSVSDEIQRLQLWLYGQAEVSLDEIRYCLIDICCRRMPLLKIGAMRRRTLSR
jgi:hypothetical protein